MVNARQDAIQFWNPASIAVLALSSFALSVIGTRLLHDKSGLAALFLLMLIQVAPFAFSFSTGRLNFLSFVMFNHLVTYSVAKLNQLFHIHKLSTVYPETLATVQELTLCSMLIILSYYSFYPFIMKGVNRGDHKPLFLGKRLQHGTGIFVLLHTYLTVSVPSSVRSIEIVLYFICVVLLFSGQPSRPSRWMTFYRIAAVAAAFHHFLRFGMLVYAGTVGGVIFVTVCLQRKMRNLLALSFVALMLCALQPIKSWYRNVIKNVPQATFVENLGALSSLAAWKYFGAELDEDLAAVAGITIDEFDIEEDPTDQTKDALAKGFGRIGDDSLERVLAWTPSKVPFWGGESYANIPFMFIPRLLWPGKPAWNFWNKFGRQYGFLSSDDYTTSVGVGYLGEAYMNFGFLGLYSCAIFFGLLVLVVERLSYMILGGGYSFLFTCYLSTVISFGNSLGSTLNGIAMITVILFAMRTRLNNLKTP
ncbi:MAG: hypothetical protein KDD51_07005 [Bdellovibrionales bacterium]|nr:hypothetical protein [Bdellovibrionales bacterium]